MAGCKVPFAAEGLLFGIFIPEPTEGLLFGIFIPEPTGVLTLGLPAGLPWLFTGALGKLFIPDRSSPGLSFPDSFPGTWKENPPEDGFFAFGAAEAVFAFPPGRLKEAADFFFPPFFASSIFFKASFLAFSCFCCAIYSLALLLL